MATSESDDFESADEELDNRSRAAALKQQPSLRTHAVVDSESDDDTECTSVIQTPANSQFQKSRSRSNKRRGDPDSQSSEEDTELPSSPTESTSQPEKQSNITSEKTTEHQRPEKQSNVAPEKTTASHPEKQSNVASEQKTTDDRPNPKQANPDSDLKLARKTVDQKPKASAASKPSSEQRSDAKSEEAAESHSQKTEEKSRNRPSGVSKPVPEIKSTVSDGSESLEIPATEVEAAIESIASDRSQSGKSRGGRNVTDAQKKAQRQQKQGAKKLGSKLTPGGAKLGLVASGSAGKATDSGKAIDSSKATDSGKATDSSKAIDSGKATDSSKAIDSGKASGESTDCWDELDEILSKRRPSEESRQKRSVPEWNEAWDDPKKPDGVEECWEGMDEDIEIPEELKSDKKFKEVFSSEGWNRRDDNSKIVEEYAEEKILPVLERLSSAGQEQESSGSWGWGGWGVSSLINTATAGVSTLTSHVSQGLSMLEESIGAPDPEELASDERKEESTADGRNPSQKEQEDPQVVTSSFGFGNLMSGVSSITKLVESTSNKVIAGGLDTLESIGKKTMEVLQDGDPGLKKKRAFFVQEGDKPILSQILREAKERADTEEKTLEEKQLARKVHFESLFDDCQGLVHLEALEMLSKQCDMRIQQRMLDLDGEELSSVQETLDEVNELCDLGDEDELEDVDGELKDRLESASKDLGVEVTYEKLLETWQLTKTYLSTVTPTDTSPSDTEVFQRTISTLARFTALSVERFHKTAELLLIKERRSTVNEADALVQLTNILAGEIGVIANLFADKLNERTKTSSKPEAITANITSIFLEAANASSYIQDAFKLLIPVLQVGAT